MSNKLKVLFIGEYMKPTGFGQVMRAILKHLTPVYEVTLLETTVAFEKPEQMYHGFRLLGGTDTGDAFSFKRIQQLDLNQFDVIFMINDVWGIDQFLTVFKMKDYKGKVVVYFPVDAKEHDPDWYGHFDIVSKAVTYTQFGRAEVAKAAPQLLERGCLEVIPHGIDTDLFFAIDKPMNTIREELWGTDKYNDDFIFLSAHRNQPRKRLDISMKAFSIFAAGKTDVKLYMHCGNNDMSLNIVKLAARYGISEKMMMTGGVNSSGAQRLPDEKLNQLYNACNIGLTSSLGEGWGLPVCEMGSIGRPQIAPNHSACKELLSDFCELIHISAEHTQDKIMTVGGIPDVLNMAAIMETYYYSSALYEQVAKKTAEKFNRPEFMWKNICKKWVEIINSVAFLL